MTCVRALGLPAFAAILAAGPAFANVTPEDVWENWKTASASSGSSIAAASEAREGDTLVLSGVTMQMIDGDSQMSATVGDVRLRDRGDGSVDIVMEPDYVIGMNIAEPGGPPIEIRLRVLQDFEMTASGSADAMRYDMNGPSLSVLLEGLTVGGEDMPLEVEMTFSDIAGGSLYAGADARDVTTDMTAAAVKLAISASNPDGEGDLSFNLDAEDLALNFEGTMVPGMDFEDLGAMLRAGFRIEGGYSIGATSFDFDFEDDFDSMAATGEMTSGRTDLALDAGRIAYSGATTGFDVTMSGAAIPFPEINVRMSEYALGLLVPLAVTDEPGDFSFLARIVDLSVTDAIWGMIDPMGALPRDPATLIVDAAGKAKLLADITDPMALAMAGEPAELHALDLTELRISAAGAELSGSGGFTFDNSDRETFDGMPRPAGAVDLTLVGGNGLLDRLVEMGLLPQDQVMGARMMMGLFGRPGDGPDTLHSTIEVTPDGAVLANGQRIQ